MDVEETKCRKSFQPLSSWTSAHHARAAQAHPARSHVCLVNSVIRILMLSTRWKTCIRLKVSAKERRIIVPSETRRSLKTSSSILHSAVVPAPQESTTLKAIAVTLCRKIRLRLGLCMAMVVLVNCQTLSLQSA